MPCTPRVLHSIVGLNLPLELWRFKSKPPCVDDIVIAPVVTLPLIQEVFPISYRPSEGTTILKLIGGLDIATVNIKDLIKACAYYSVVGVSKATKIQCCLALIDAKANFGNAPTSGEPVLGKSTTNKNGLKMANNKDEVPKLQGNYLRLINCLFHPRLREQYALFNCQPNKDVLTMKKQANQDLYRDALQWCCE
jgi:hypothetical protein